MKNPKLTKFDHHFDRWFIKNRWKQEFWHRDASWTFFGASIRWSGADKYSFRIHLFGIDLHFWFTVIPKAKQ